MSQQSENAKQLLYSVVNLLEQKSWESLSLIEKEQVKHKLSGAFDELFSASTKVNEKEPSRDLEVAVEMPFIEVEKVESTIETKTVEVSAMVEGTPELFVQQVEPEEKIKVPEFEPLAENKLPLQNPIPEEDDDKQKASLNERFNKEKTTLADKITRPQGSLKTSIDVNEKFFFIRDLFGADGNAYDKAIRFLDNLSSMEDAMIYIERELAIQYKWESISKAREKFMKQVASRFGS